VNFDRRNFGCALCGLASLALIGGRDARAAAEDAMLKPGYRPPEGSDEKGLWSMMDRAERELASSRFVVRDPALNAYVRDVICRLGKDHCLDIRAYIVRTPHFNASMAPNGMMEVWTGLLLRCSDEAQFAAIIGHEMGHYLRRHSLQRFRDVRDKSSFGAFLGLGLAVAGAGAAGILTDLALMASIFSFSREQEREADDIGLTLMTSAGYAPAAASEVWAQLIAESHAGTAPQSQSIMFASHPAPEERMTTLRQSVERQGGGAGDRGFDRFLAGVSGVREQAVRDELALRQYGRSETVFDRLLAQVPDDGLLWYAKGEVYRLRGQPDDLGRAMQSYEKALRVAGAPPETYRSIVLIEVKRGAKSRAQAAFDSYLNLKPDASDAEALRMLLNP
jgi:beta-barrel assembly-enhancing protease